MPHPNDMTSQLLDGAENITGRARAALENVTSAFGLVLGNFALEALTPEDIDPERKDQIDRICTDLAGIMLQAGRVLQDATAAGLFDPTGVGQVDMKPSRTVPLALTSAEANGHPEPVPSGHAGAKGTETESGGGLATDSAPPARTRESRYETDNPLYKGLLQGITNPETASPDFEVEIVDDAKVRVNGQTMSLNHHEVCMLNVLLLHRGEFIARSVWFEHGFHDRAGNESARGQAFTHAKNIFEDLVHPKGTVVEDNGKNASALKYRIREEVTVIDRRNQAHSHAAHVQDVPQVEVKKKTRNPQPTESRDLTTTHQYGPWPALASSPSGESSEPRPRFSRV